MPDLKLPEREHLIVQSVIDTLKERISSLGDLSTPCDVDTGYWDALIEIEAVFKGGQATGPLNQWKNNPVRLTDQLPLKMVNPCTGQEVEVTLKFALNYRELLACVTQKAYDSNTIMNQQMLCDTLPDVPKREDNWKSACWIYTEKKG